MSKLPSSCQHDQFSMGWQHVISPFHPLDVQMEHAEGIYIFDTEGRRYIDVAGGPMATSVGHNDKRMKQAIIKQLNKYPYGHPALIRSKIPELCSAIASVAPGDLNVTTLATSGSDAVESAIKLARSYHAASDNIGKYKVISNYDSYHGMTLATQSLSGNPGLMQQHEPMLPKWHHIHQYSDHSKPKGIGRDEWGKICAQELERTIYFEGPDTVAAYIATPVGSGSDYGLVAPISYWQEIRRICDEYNVLLIADEVVTGFGRTGKWFGMEHFDIQADIMTMAKGISSSYVPLAAVTISDRINQVFLDGADYMGGFTHSGHALSCTAGIEAINILKTDDLVNRSAVLGARLHECRARLLAHPSVADIRGQGLFMVLELVKSKETRDFFAPDIQAENLLQQTAIDNGLVLYCTLYTRQQRPLHRRGMLKLIAPPLSITEAELEEMVDRIDKTLTDWEGKLGIGEG